MDSALQKAIQDSTVLSDETRQKLMAAGDRLTLDQAGQVIGILQNAETKKKELDQQRDLAKRDANQQYIAHVKEFFQHVLPKTLKQAEAQERSSEQVELNSILSELDNV